MFKTGYIYHFITAAVFIGMGLYLIFVNPAMLDSKGINPLWLGGILLVWGFFRGINGYLMRQRKSKSDDEK